MANKSGYQQELATVKKEVKELKVEMVSLKEAFEDHILTEDEKKMIDNTIKTKKEGKLSTHKQLFGQ